MNKLSVFTRRHFLYGAAATLACSQLSLSQAPVQSSPLWLVERDGGRALLVGESLPRPNDWHDPKAETLLKSCAGIWNETNQTYRGTQKELIERFGLIQPGSKPPAFTPNDETRLARAANDCKISLIDLAGARPWLIGATLEDAFYRAVGLNGKSANTILSAHATQERLPIYSEFTVKDDVFAWFGAMTPEQDMQYLRYVLDGIEIGRAGTERISTAWAAGDPGPATSMVDKERTSYPSLYQRLTLDRTRRWLPRVHSCLQSGKQYLFVIGLYHMAGPDGLLAQLPREGFRVSRL